MLFADEFAEKKKKARLKAGLNSAGRLRLSSATPNTCHCRHPAAEIPLAGH